ncbi:MAG: class I SAM-dependent methyltransferase [Acidimicrobiales bacterium]
MNVLRRVANRSGELVFDPEADSLEAVERADVLRYGWVTDWVREWGLGTGRVLDLGCWTGGFLRQLDRQVGCGEIWGVDLDGPWLDVARQAVPSGTFAPITGLLELRKAVEGDFDFVFFLETIEHLPRGSEGRTLRAIAEVIRPGGSLVLSTPYAGPLTPLDPAWALIGHRHYRVPTLRSLLEAAGFEIDEIGYAGNLYEVAGEYRFLAIKHLRHKIVAPQPFLRQRADTGITPDRNPTSTGVYVRARKL